MPDISLEVALAERFTELGEGEVTLFMFWDF